MPSPADRPSSAASGPVPAANSPAPGTRRPRRRRVALRLTIAGLGVAAGSTLLQLLWPPPDRSSSQTALVRPDQLANPPSRPVTVLVLGLDGDRRGAANNGAAPPGPANSDAMLLVRINPQGPLQVLSLPTELAVRLPGQQTFQPLGGLYRQGGVALSADVVRELVGLAPEQPDRYVVMPREALRHLVDSVGSLELSPDRPMRYEDRRQRYRIALEAGLQPMTGEKVEQMLRFRDPVWGEAGRRDAVQQVIPTLVEAMARPEMISQWPSLVGQLEGKVETNLSRSELLSLLAVTLSRPQAIRFSTLPLAPRQRPDQPLRQIDPRAPEPYWPPASP